MDFGRKREEFWKKDDDRLWVNSHVWLLFLFYGLRTRLTILALFFKGGEGKELFLYFLGLRFDFGFLGVALLLYFGKE